MKAVETIMEIKAVYLFISCRNDGNYIKALIVLKSIYLLIKWPQLIWRLKFSKQIFVTSRKFATRQFF